MGIGIREARSTLPTLIKRAAQDNEDVQIGARGADEVTLVASGKYERMRRELDRLRSKVKQLNARLDSLSDDAEVPVVEKKPFAGLQRALEEGRLSLKPDDTPRVRTVFPDYTGISSFSREERRRMGSNAPEPEFRRTLPRA